MKIKSFPYGNLWRRMQRNLAKLDMIQERDNNFGGKRIKNLLFQNNLPESWPALFHAIEPRVQCQNHINSGRNLCTI